MTALEGLSLLASDGRGSNGLRLLAAAARCGASPLLARHTADGRTSLVLRHSDADRLLTARDAAVHRRDEVALVAAVGEGLVARPANVAELLAALGRADVPLLAVSDGASADALAVVVESALAGAAATAFHELVSRPAPPRRLALVQTSGAGGGGGR